MSEKTHRGMSAVDPKAKLHELGQRSRVSMVVPAATMVAAWGVRRLMVTGYRATTGRRPPAAEDRDVSLAQVLVWTVASTTAIAVVQVLVIRAVTNAMSHEE